MQKDISRLKKKNPQVIYAESELTYIVLEKYSGTSIEINLDGVLD